MAYCTIPNVKRILRVLGSSTDNQHKVRFSDSYTLPQSYSTNSGSIQLGGISDIITSYAGSEFWDIKFTSTEDFTLYRGEGEVTTDGTGDINNNFTSSSGIITINSSEWSGTPVSGDKVKFRTDSNISNTDVSDFIADADAIIDGILNKEIDDSNLPFTTIPALVERASIYLSANLVFASVFSTLNTEEMPAIVRRWYTFGNNLVYMYLDSIASNTNKKFKKYARFVSREALFDTVGLSDVAGVDGLKGEIETVDVEYDYDENTKESIGAT